MAVERVLMTEAGSITRDRLKSDTLTCQLASTSRLADLRSLHGPHSRSAWYANYLSGKCYGQGFLPRPFNFG